MTENNEKIAEFIKQCESIVEEYGLTGESLLELAIFIAEQLSEEPNEQTKLDMIAAARRFNSFITSPSPML